jgi:CTP-dependent riboflavin kinase
MAGRPSSVSSSSAPFLESLGKAATESDSKAEPMKLVNYLQEQGAAVPLARVIEDLRIPIKALYQTLETLGGAKLVSVTTTAQGEVIELTESGQQFAKLAHMK